VKRTMVVVGYTRLAELHTARVLVALHTMVVAGRFVVVMAQPTEAQSIVMLYES